MPTIRCAACGCAYNYHHSETCPRCGAYNRPPHRVMVDSDGTLHNVTAPVRPAHDLKAAPGKVKQGKVCYEEKECHERKECHEETARRVRTENLRDHKPRMSRVESTYEPAEGASDPQSEFQRQLRELGTRYAGVGGRSHKGKVTGKGTAAAIVLAILVAVVPNIFESCQSHHVSVPEPDFWAEAPAEEWENMEELEKDVLDGMGIRAVYQVGDIFTWQGQDMNVTECGLSDGQMSVTVPDFPGGTESCELLVLDEGSSAEGYSFHYCPCEHYYVNSRLLVFNDVGDAPMAMWLLFYEGDEALAVQLL